MPLRPSKHRAVSATVTMLAKDPSLGGKQIAGELGISVSRLARVFKRDMGMSLVEYRNRLRLDRFWVLVDGGRPSLLEAALAAGFGSYAQFHRVFRAQRHLTPREYLRRRRADGSALPEPPSLPPPGDPALDGTRDLELASVPGPARFHPDAPGLSDPATLVRPPFIVH
ncbi:MAG TPA: AraC family transcriptional regulator [Polyangia bacterium]|nr:AraC family transcriptional regulator [Polyangia bacterium]